MRISDWSSDVCSSDLHRRCAAPSLLPQAFLRPLYRHAFQRTAEQITRAGRSLPAGGRQGRGHKSGRVLPTHGKENLADDIRMDRSEEHTSELQSLMRISYAVFRLKKKTKTKLQKHI